MSRDRRALTRWQPPVSFLPKSLREPRRPLLALTVGWAAAFLPTIALGAAVTAVMPGRTIPQLPAVDAYLFFLIVIAAPLLETLAMGAALLLLRLLVGPTAAVLISAVGWGIAHSTVAPAWGLVIWWPFLIFSTIFLTWSARSLPAAVAMAAATHGLHNLLPALLLLLGLGR